MSSSVLLILKARSADPYDAEINALTIFDVSTGFSLEIVKDLAARQTGL